MPTSTWESISYLIDIIMNLNPRPKLVLDIGIGFGKYGFLLREYLTYWGNRYEERLSSPIINGIEVFPEYIKELQQNIYDQIIVGNITELIMDIGDKDYDLIMLIDVLEHFTLEDGYKLLEQCSRIGRTTIVSTPAVWEPQGEAFHNSFEKHLSIWNKKMLKKAGAVYASRISDSVFLAVISDDVSIKKSVIRYSSYNNRLRKIVRLLLPLSIRAMLNRPVQRKTDNK